MRVVELTPETWPSPEELFGMFTDTGFELVERRGANRALVRLT
ncbi:hypothetical protein B0I31_10655 [Saccharothrix carnea]|uniref:GNAT family N-acetyltransferase n=1 Tax=Saccharothrix carnea TaxID=1280637 RepID=A0A2P8I7V8_SACCR|nr:hypothetical protein [Saccharothrix carnea]PSL54541.1 hypothetical protein B0I31_10655 [Saccharothrix carnea]